MPYSINPATEEKIAEYSEMDFEAVEEILKKTSKAAHLWSAVPIEERIIPLIKAAELLEDRKKELALLITREMGKPISESTSEIEKCAWVCRHYAENGPGYLEDESLPSDAEKSYMAFRPLGVVLAVMPWNFPFWQVFRFAAPGLTAGNGGILKHASNVTGCALAIEKVIQDAGYPEHLFRTIIASSETVEKAIESQYIQAATLTGSEAAGSAVAAKAGEQIKKSVLELGGSDPYLILEDADLDKAAELCAKSRFINGGQSCIAAKRFIVLKSVKEAFLDKLVEAISGMQVGNPEDEDTDIGPMAREDLRDEIDKQVTRSVEKGAKVVMTGKIPDGPGFYYPPTVLDNVEEDMPAFSEELFGPVAAIITVSDENEAIAVANQSTFGLGSAVFTRDLQKGEAIASKIQAGCCFINDFVKSDPRLPFGGIKRSGYGRELAREGIREFVNIQTVVVN